MFDKFIEYGIRFVSLFIPINITMGYEPIILKIKQFLYLNFEYGLILVFIIVVMFRFAVVFFDESVKGRVVDNEEEESEDENE